MNSGKDCLFLIQYANCPTESITSRPEMIALARSLASLIVSITVKMNLAKDMIMRYTKYQI